jgi:hypothetical protein
MSGRGGMGSPYGFGGMGQPNMVRGMKPNSSPMDAMTRTMEGSRGIGSSASTAPTAETALSRLNLNKNYADGGYVNQFDFKSGGLNSLAEYGDNPVGMAKGGYLNGPGDGMSDSIPATIEGKQKARLADGEFVIPADVVSHVGNGSTKAGAKRFYKMLADVRKARTGSTKQGKQIKPEKYMPA